VPDPLAWFYSATLAWNHTGVNTTIETLVDLGRELAVPLSDFLDGLDGVGGGPGLSRERVQQEAKLREVARGLSDRDLRLALTLAEAMAGC